MLVPAAQRSESATCTHVSLPSLAPHHPIHLGPHSAELSSRHCWAPGPHWLVYTRQCRNVSPRLLVHPPPLPSPTRVHPSTLYVCISSPAQPSKNDTGSLVETRMDLESVTQSEGSQTEKNKRSHIDIYMWNPEKWYRWTYLLTGD